jgi:hypothetical protein
VSQQNIPYNLILQQNCCNNLKPSSLDICCSDDKGASHDSILSQTRPCLIYKDFLVYSRKGARSYGTLSRFDCRLSIWWATQLRSQTLSFIKRYLNSNLSTKFLFMLLVPFTFLHSIFSANKIHDLKYNKTTHKIHFILGANSYMFRYQGAILMEFINNTLFRL